MLGKAPDEVNVIVLHLGNGASASTPVRGGVSIDTSMGMTPLEGLVMGTEPAILHADHLPPGSTRRPQHRRDRHLVEQTICSSGWSGTRTCATSSMPP